MPSRWVSSRGVAARSAQSRGPGLLRVPKALHGRTSSRKDFQLLIGTPMTKAVVTTRTWHRGSASVPCLGSSGDGLATVSNRDQREEGHWNYPALDRRGRARGRLAALVLVGVGATATACRTDALPTPRPLPAPIVAAEEGALASLTRADGVRKICEGRAAAEAASAERPVDGLGAPIRRREKLTDDNDGRDSFPGLVSDVAKGLARRRAREFRACSHKRGAGLSRHVGFTTRRMRRLVDRRRAVGRPGTEMPTNHHLLQTSGRRRCPRFPLKSFRIARCESHALTTVVGHRL